MKCRIKRVGKNTYFERNIDKNFNHWVLLRDAKIFTTVFIAKEMIRKYKLKNVEIEKVQNEREIFK